MDRQNGAQALMKFTWERQPEAEKLVRVEMTPTDRAQAAGNWSRAMAGTMERRTGPKKLALEASLSPASRWDPRIPGVPEGPAIRSRMASRCSGVKVATYAGAAPWPPRNGCQ